MSAAVAVVGGGGRWISLTGTRATTSDKAKEMKGIHDVLFTLAGLDDETKRMKGIYHVLFTSAGFYDKRK